MSDKYLRDEKSQLLNRLGTEAAWGWSPAVDFTKVVRARSEGCSGSQRNSETPILATSEVQESAPVMDGEDAFLENLMKRVALKKKSTDTLSDGAAAGDTSNDVHVLLAGASDFRHILRTAASQRQQEVSTSGVEGNQATAPTYHYYVYEPNLRLHCRQLFFLQWLLDSTFALEELEEQVLMFLDVYGNSLLRDKSAAQMRNVLSRIKAALNNPQSALLKMACMDGLLMKERDFIISQLELWAKDTSSADIEDQWTQRVRQDLADRYDNRDNLIDWDFTFYLKDYTNLIKFPEYRGWRKTGVAFDVALINPRRGFEYNYTVPNRSLCVFDRLGRGTYTGDIKNGPLVALGSVTENEHIRARTADGTCKYGNAVVAMHNVRAWLYTLMTGLPWPWADHKYAWDDDKDYNYLPPGTPSGVTYEAKLPKIVVHFAALDFEKTRLRVGQKKWPRFDAAFIGTSCAHLLSDKLVGEMMQPSTGVVICETAKFVVDAEDAAKEAFLAKLDARVAGTAWRRDTELQKLLHAGQPSPPAKSEETIVSESQKLALSRYHMPFHVAYVPLQAK